MFVSWEVNLSPAANVNEGFVLTNQEDCSNGLQTRTGHSFFSKTQPGSCILYEDITY